MRCDASANARLFAAQPEGLVACILNTMRTQTDLNMQHTRSKSGRTRIVVESRPQMFGNIRGKAVMCSSSIARPQSGSISVGCVLRELMLCFMSTGP